MLCFLFENKHLNKNKTRQRASEIWKNNKIINKTNQFNINYNKLCQYFERN